MEKWLGSLVWFMGRKGMVDDVDGWDFKQVHNLVSQIGFILL